jgi:hypothetical protein
MGLSARSKRLLAWRMRRALRAAERVVLGASAFAAASLVLTLAVLVMGPRLLDGPPALASATAEEVAYEGAPDLAAPGVAPAAPEAGGPSPGRILCAPEEELVYAWTDTMAVVADGSGHFALYGAPDPETGQPTRDSYDLLRGCTPDGSFVNLAAIAVAGSGGGEEAAPQILSAGAESARTYKTEVGALVTEYALPGGLLVSQELGLVPGEGGAGALEIRYRVENASGETRSVSLASLLAPALFVGPPGAVNGSPFVSGTLAEAGVDPAIRTERALTLAAGEVGPVDAPRPGVASDSSGLWSPGPTGNPPDVVSLAGWASLRSDPFGYEAQPDVALPAAAALAARWSDRSVAPGEAISFSEWYGLPPHR